MTTIVGILQMAGRGGEVFPDGKNELGTIYIPQGELHGAPFGMKVVVELTSPVDAEQHTGKIIEVLGDPSLPDVAMDGIIFMHGLSKKFPEEVLAAAEKIPQELSGEMVAEALAKGRRDLRSLKTLTIDGLDAKDLDDAISIERTENKGYRLWVHIADVSEYVKEDSLIDVEALKRGTSVYLADRVLPMLPPRLSNGICSLNPEVDRFTLSVCIDYDQNANVIDGDIMESVINSNLRANYDDVLRTIDAEKAVEGYEDFENEILLMAELAHKLAKKAENRGSLEFDFPETKVKMGNDGKVEDIYPVRQHFANELIEQFMVAANEFVAAKCTALELPFIYRVHEMPDQERLDEFRSLVKRQGFTVKIPHDPQPKDLAKVLLELREMPGSEALQSKLLRSLAKAEYLEDPIGHFGLALADYSHFTSPIRRYPDLFIHRVIKGFLRVSLRVDLWAKKAPKVAKQASLSERAAIEAERDSIDQKVAEFYSDKIGEVYDAEITGFVGAGMFVRLPSSAEGMIPFRSMNDYYVFDEITMTAQGKGNKRLFRIGDSFQVQIARVDTIRRQVDLSVYDESKAGVIDMEFQQASNQEKRNGQSRNRSKSSGDRKRSSKNNREKNSGRARKNSRGKRGGGRSANGSTSDSRSSKKSASGKKRSFSARSAKGKFSDSRDGSWGRSKSKGKKGKASASSKSSKTNRNDVKRSKNAGRKSSISQSKRKSNNKKKR